MPPRIARDPRTGRGRPLPGVPGSARLSRLRLAGLGAVAVMSGTGAALTVGDDTAAPAVAEAADTGQTVGQVATEGRIAEAPAHPVEVDATLIRSVARQILVDQQQPETLTNLDLIARDVLAQGPVAPGEVYQVTERTMLGHGPGGPPVAPEPQNSPCPPTARACIDVDGKVAWLQEEGRMTYGPVPITTGRPGYETTRGSHHVLRHVRDDHSRIFDSPMPYSTYFTVGGMAFHEGRLDEPSHGCIHLGHHSAVRFFDQLRVGDEIHAF